MTEMKFWRMALPFIMVNAVVWGVASIALPVLAGSDSRAGLVFAMLNLGLAIGAFIWGYLSRKVGLSILLFSSTLFSAAVWIVLVLLDGILLPFLAFVFGIFAAAIWALATVQVTRSYPKQEWDSRIARMQSFLVLGQVMGLLIASASSKPVLGIPLLGLAVLATLPVRLAGERAAVSRFVHSQHHIPKARIFDILTGHSHVNFKLSHLIHLKNIPLLIFYIRWILVLLAPAPVFAVFPLLMKGTFNLNTSMASIVFAGSTFASVLVFVAAAKLARKRSAFTSFNIGVLVCLAGFLMMYGAAIEWNRWIGVGGFVLVIVSWAFVSTGMNIGVVKLVNPEKEGEALGLANMLMSLDNMIGGLAGGILAAAFGYSVILIIGVGLSAGALVLEVVHVPMRKTPMKEKA